MSKQFAVIGNPIEQSRSPELHHAFAAKTWRRPAIIVNVLRHLMASSPTFRNFLAHGGSGHECHRTL